MLFSSEDEQAFPFATIDKFARLCESTLGRETARLLKNEQIQLNPFFCKFMNVCISVSGWGFLICPLVR
jgi:hypothetical protein